MLAGNADRERTVDVLRAAFAEGRLTKEEYDQRSGRALAARTLEELQQLTSDVPHGPGAVPPAVPAVFQPRPPYAGPPVHPAYRRPYPAFSPPPPPRPTNAAAIGALVCGLLTPITLGVSGLPAVILGHKARAEIRRTGDQGDGSAVAGLALGWVALGILLLVLVAG
ncbi:DUF1707 and DUF4190 domain-containing protein [Streptomyces sp. JJ36]|uniref:DUF1707 and DUF4190 domain-containing protein n=1 Tax=Streptomyces sp. JJ36 TaxID=2736645 RepID=UPI001F27889E|nr:DUF1707 and DUF4190 domain-containing protein [Streptomyces sp. JJ36]MCF6523529.1 DUF1707 and DUF4190 domain-containing protein [Streptomyces sp. JJ36]